MTAEELAKRAVSSAWRFLTGRTGAYRRVFARENLDAQRVLRDLAKFCRAHSSTGHADPAMAARLDGRREAWLRIQQHLHLSDDELWRLFGAKTE